MQPSIRIMSALILAGFLAACQSAPIAELVARPGQVLFQDDFSNPKSGWLEATNANGSMGYVDDSYQMLVISPGYDLRAYSGHPYRDVQVEVDATRLSGPVYNRFGLTCRVQDVNNFYFFVISSDGYYTIGKINQGVTTHLGQEMMAFSGSILQGSALNHLRFDCIGNTLKGYVNGQLIALTDDADFVRGDTGLISGTFSEGSVYVSFDNFVVYKP